VIVGVFGKGHARFSDELFSFQEPRDLLLSTSARAPHQSAGVKLKQRPCRRDGASICSRSTRNSRTTCLRSRLVVVAVVVTVFFAAVVALPLVRSAEWARRFRSS